MEIYRHKNGEFLRLITRRKSNINTFVQCDINGVDILKKRVWSRFPDTQRRLVKGFSRLIRIEIKET